MASFFHQAEAGEPLWSVFRHFLQRDAAFKTVADVHLGLMSSELLPVVLLFDPSHRSVTKGGPIRFFKSKDMQAGLSYLGRCELCRLVMTSLTFLECLDG